jgi:serine/threonine-protein kinase HipA
MLVALGGARPKASVTDELGQLWIAKFPSRNDITNCGAWEKTANDLALRCGLNVPEARLETFSSSGSTY